MRKIIYALLVSIMILSHILNANAAASDDNFNIKLRSSGNDLLPSDILEVSIYIKSENARNIKSIKSSIIYDRNSLLIKRVKSLNEKCKVYSENENGHINMMISCKNFEISKDSSYVELFMINFKVKKQLDFKNDNAIVSNIKGKLTEICDIDDNVTSDVLEDEIKININRPKGPNCLLKSLIPSAGKLSPKFNPTTFNYTIDVDSETNMIEFDLDTADPEAYSKINRKRLGKAGSSTDITITVKSSSKRGFKQIYNILVNRSEKEAKPKKTRHSNSKKNKSGKECSSSDKSHRHKNEDNDEFINPRENIPYTLVINENRFSSFIIGLFASVAISYIFLFKLRKSSNNEEGSNNKSNTE